MLGRVAAVEWERQLPKRRFASSGPTSSSFVARVYPILATTPTAAMLTMLQLALGDAAQPVELPPATPSLCRACLKFPITVIRLSSAFSQGRAYLKCRFT